LAYLVGKGCFVGTQPWIVCVLEDSRRLNRSKSAWTVNPSWASLKGLRVNIERKKGAGNKNTGNPQGTDQHVWAIVYIEFWSNESEMVLLSDSGMQYQEGEMERGRRSYLVGTLYCSIVTRLVIVNQRR
jgi:hypothetical protein